MKEEVVRLYNLGYSYKEIAETLDVPLTKIKYIFYYLGKTNKLVKRGKGISKSKKGEKHNRAKLKESDVEFIWQKYLQCRDYEEVHSRFANVVTKDTIQKIIYGRSWKHIREKYKHLL